jgi:hypothetical protein
LNPSSYFFRCQQWLGSQSAISTELLEQTLDKFTRQLDSLQDEELELADDLIRTMELLEQALGARQAVSAEPAAAAAAPGAPETLLDFSPLVPDTGPAPVLSAEEKQQRLRQLLAHEGIARGVGDLKRR